MVMYQRYILVLNLLIHNVLVEQISYDEVSQFGECFDSFRPTYLRIAGSREKKPNIVLKTDMLTCAHHCRRNIDPTKDTPFPCEGFNFRVGRKPTCEFFGINKMDTPPIHSQQLAFYFEKTCLRIPARCEESAFIFDVRRGFRLKAVSENRIARSEKDCQEACLTENCVAFEWNSRKRRCGVYNTTKRDADMEKIDEVNYYESNCIPPTSRCPSGRIEFLIAKKSDAPSFGVSVGVRSMRNCMRECVETTFFYCRSFQFDPASNDCFVSYESSDVAVPSNNLDLYEPICVSTDFVTSCNKPYAFEKILTTKMMHTKELEKIERIPIDKCLSLCLMRDNSCRSVNYDVNIRCCYLLDKSRMDTGIVLGRDDNFDYYEVACLTVTAMPVTNRHQEKQYELLKKKRILLQEYCNRHFSNVTSSEQCWHLCEHHSLMCTIFSYSEAKAECMISYIETDISHNYEKFTEENPLFNVFIGQQSGPFSYHRKLFEASSFPTLIGELEIRNSTQPVTGENVVLNATLPSSQQNTEKTRHNIVNSSITQENRAKEQISLKSSLPATTENEFNLLNSINSREDSIPHLVSINEHNGFIQPEKLHVTAQCYHNGVNVTFQVDGSNTYTGAIYAVERFDQCRVLVTNAKEFAIFITRPRHNTWCNALEVEDIMSAIIVMSNDCVVPHDVTTKDDLFYQITCNYSESRSNKINKGSVLGGLSPIAIHSTQAPRSISLQIMKKGRVVDSVLIGETLTARVESTFPAERLRIVNCTAYRVGGSGLPASINLIADGCALLPSLMSPMRRGPHGWESSLSAFRIEGSEQIDMVCMISICPEKVCPESNISCSSPRNRSIRSLIVREPVRVDRRLFVRGNRESLSGDNRVLPEICLQPHIYISAFAVVFIAVLFVGLSVSAGIRKRNNPVCSVNGLLPTASPTSLGAKYIKTVSL